MQGFGEVCRRVRMARGLSQVHVARTGGLQQARVSANTAMLNNIARMQYQQQQDRLLQQQKEAKRQELASKRAAKRDAARNRNNPRLKTTEIASSTK